MATAKQKAWRAEFGRRYGKKKSGRAKSPRRAGGSMARKGRRSSSGFGGGSGDMVGNLLAGMGIAAATKRFVGAPLGAYTGIAAAGAYSAVRKKNMLATVAGAAIHDFIGNVGGASGSSGFGNVY